MKHPAPATLEVIIALKDVMQKTGMKVEELIVEINKHLPEPRQLNQGHSGAVQLYRWLNPTGRNWSEPKAEIILAFQKVVELKKEEKNH